MQWISLTLYFFLINNSLANRPQPQNRSSESAIERKIAQAGLVNIQEVDSTLKVDLRYSSTNNFLHADVYGELNRCYLQKDAALMLAAAQKYLKEMSRGYDLLVFDGARPRSVQYQMWEIVKGTAMQPYVANPATGSIHNYGAAVDLTIVDEKGNELDMGTPFDFFDALAQPRLEEQFLKDGKLNEKQLANRKLLREVMTKAGFKIINNEWWHFDAFPKEQVRKKYKIIE